MSTDLAALNRAYQAEHSRYEKLAGRVQDVLAEALRESGLRCELACRAKDVPSFLRKALAKAYADPLTEITDKAGVRVISNYPDDATAVARLIEGSFDVQQRDDKSEGRPHDLLGYGGIHYLVRLKDRSISSSELALRGLLCEVQLHTRAQSAWAEVSHDLLYKPNVEPSNSVKRQLYRLIALVELFDSEVESARRQIREDPAYPEALMLATLERLFLPLAAHDFSRELSIRVLSVLRESYSVDELARFDSILERFVQQNRGRLLELYRRYQTSVDEKALFLTQPEALAIFERLADHPESLRDIWGRHFPPELFDSLRDAWTATV